MWIPTGLAIGSTCTEPTTKLEAPIRVGGTSGQAASAPPELLVDELLDEEDALDVPLEVPAPELLVEELAVVLVAAPDEEEVAVDAAALADDEAIDVEVAVVVAELEDVAAEDPEVAALDVDEAVAAVAEELRLDAADEDEDEPEVVAADALPPEVPAPELLDPLNPELEAIAPVECEDTRPLELAAAADADAAPLLPPPVELPDFGPPHAASITSPAVAITRCIDPSAA